MHFQQWESGESERPCTVFLLHVDCFLPQTCSKPLKRVSSSREHFSTVKLVVFILSQHNRNECEARMTRMQK